MPKAMVTGASGFVGRHLTHYLRSEGWEVLAIHRDSTSADALEELQARGVETLAFSTYSELEKIAAEVQPAVVFHLAAHQAKDYTASDVSSFLDANIAFGTHLLEGLVDSGCVFINSASYFQFRNGKPAPHSLYSATKQAFIEISAFYREKRGLDIRHVVLYDNFGPSDSRNKLVPQLLQAVGSGNLMALGPANQPINALYVDDVVTGLIAASKPGNPEFMTVRADSSHSVAEIVRTIERIALVDLKASFDRSRAPNDIVERSGDWPLPAGWSPRWTLDEGLRATHASFQY